MTSSSPSAAHYESGTDRLLVEVSGPVATVTFNNPDKQPVGARLLARRRAR